MHVFSLLYTEVLWRPLFNGLVFFHNVVPGHDTGVAIVALTVAIRLALAPLLWRAQTAQKKLAVIQPELKRIQEKHKGDRESQSKALMELYAEHQVNPLSGCMILLIQLPVLIALFQVFRKGLDSASLTYVYSFLARPDALPGIAFGFLDLTRGSIWLGVIAAVSQFFQTKLSTSVQPTGGAAGGDFAKALQWQTTYFFPLLILLWSYSLPAALTLYWTAMNLFGIVEQLILLERIKLSWIRKQSKTSS
jgi:YidC/Oxa1 family membrane protein insertase